MDTSVQIFALNFLSILGRLSFDRSKEKTAESHNFLPISSFNQTPISPIFSYILLLFPSSPKSSQPNIP